jgi:hypothetical protein
MRSRAASVWGRDYALAADFDGATRDLLDVTVGVFGSRGGGLAGWAYQ